MIQAAMRPRYGVVERKTSALFKLYIHITPRHFSWSFFTELEPDLIMHDMDICEPEGKAFISSYNAPLITSALAEDADHSSYTSLESAITVVDRELRRLLDYKLSLHASRNQLLPIFRLPPELLVKIFKFCTPTFDSFSWDSDAWISFSQVCRHWRAVAVGSPSLWVHPCMGHLELVRESLVRSQSQPLSVVLFHPGDVERRDAAKLVLKKVALTEDLSIWADDGKLDHFLRTNSGSTPGLKRLRLRCDSESTLSFQPSGSLQELDTFLTAAIHLEELVLEGCGPSPQTFQSSSPFNNLIRLFIDHTGYLKARQQISEILTLLRVTPRLAELRVQSAIQLGLPVPALIPPSPPVTLPHLVKLCLKDNLTSAAALMDSLVLPVMDKLELCTVDLAFPTRAALGSVCRHLQAWLSSPGRQAIQFMEIYTSLDSCTVIARATDSKERKREPTLHLDLRLDDAQMSMFLQTLMSKLPLRELRSLRVYSDDLYLWEPDNWGSLAMLPSLSSVVVTNSACGGLILALNGFSDNPSMLTFPSLHNLEIVGAPLHFPYATRKDSGELPHTISIIAHALKLRKARTAAKLKLSLVDCRYPSDTDPREAIGGLVDDLRVENLT